MESRAIKPHSLDEYLSVSSGDILKNGLITTFSHHLEADLPKELLIHIWPVHQDNNCTISIEHNNQGIGAINGTLWYGNDQNLEFAAEQSRNFSLYIRSIPHIQGAVSGTIAHLVDTGVIYRWYSGKILNESAKKMYDTHLVNDERLLVYPPSDETNNRYLVMRKG